MCRALFYTDDGRCLACAARDGDSLIIDQIHKEKLLFELGMDFQEVQIEMVVDPNLVPCTKPGCSPSPSCSVMN